ncbi:MAG: phosphotransferase family protein [Acidiferrobacterales bacterium]|nr:phosphotransferase family protein [Acidiferrobacterales bacterium]
MAKVRAGEELDLQKLNPWLWSHIDGLSGEPLVTQYSGGRSNWTYCLSYSERDVVLRRAPAGTKAKGAHDMGREFRLQSALKPVYTYVPEMLAFCDDAELIGSEFYVMEKLDGLIPRKEMPAALDLSSDDTKQLCTNLIDSLIALHQVDYRANGLDHLAKGEGYIERQIQGWSKRYQNAKTWNVPSAKKVIAWLEKNMPDQETICLTHNDFRLDNIVLDPNEPTKIIGVLDWELATLGDPLMDLGNSLAYWVQADDDWFATSTRLQPTHLPGMLTRDQVIEYYLRNTKLNVDDIRFYQVYGLFRLAGIVQQIYYRYHHKQTRNRAFKNMWQFVHYLLYRCRKAMK